MATRTDRAARLVAARQSAERLARRLGVATPADIDIELIAEALGAQIVVGGLRGALARGLELEGRRVIRLSDEIDHAGLRRFSTAHELGHFWLAHPAAGYAGGCTSAALEDRQAGTIEAEANAFAAELLMPGFLVEPWANRDGLDLDTARVLAREFSVSLTAAAVRLVERTSQACAVALCRGGRVVWAARSATFTAFLPRDRVPGPDAAVVELLAWGRLPAHARTISARTWLGSDVAAELELVEQAAKLPGGSDVLTFLRLR